MSKFKMQKKTIICSVVIIGVIIIPLLYSFFYLDAFWDPYKSLDSLPVAVVNLDKGALLNGENRNLGQEMCDELKADATFKFVFTDAADAQDGVKNTKYYAVITLPDNFSSCIASASTTDKKIAQIHFTSNEKRNYLATQIISRAVDEIELSVRGKVDAEIVSQLCDKLKSTPEQLTSLISGLNQLSNGASQIKDGSTALANGAGVLKSGEYMYNNTFKIFQGGIVSAQDGAGDLYTGITGLSNGIDQLTAGAKQLDNATANIDDLRTNAALLASKASEFNQSIAAYTDGVSSLISSAESTTRFLQSYVAANPSVMADPTFKQFITAMSNPANAQNITALKQYTAQLKDASSQIAQATSLLSNATVTIPQLKAGITNLKEGLVSAQSGSVQVSAGAKTLKDGLGTLSNAASQLASASGKLSDGVNKVDSGAVAIQHGAVGLKNGLNQATTTVKSTISDTKSQLAKLDGLDKFVEAPVITNQDATDAVPNYGTAFAPYFLSLSLWVGALIIFFGIYLDADEKFKLLSRNSDQKVLRSFAYLLIGFVQAILLGVILKYCLGLQTQHQLLFFFSCCLVSLVFISIVQFFLVFLKDFGKFLSIAFLILQLTSCGGTFPMETIPKFFKILYPFMPMTYSVGLLKEAISGVTAAKASFNIFVLLGILVVFMSLTIVLSAMKKRNINKGQIS